MYHSHSQSHCSLSADDDECSNTPSGCVPDSNGGQCVNTPGSFVCGCQTGYQLTASGDACDGMDIACIVSDIHRCQPSRNLAGIPAFWHISRIPAFVLERPAFMALFQNNKNR